MKYPEIKSQSLVLREGNIIKGMKAIPPNISLKLIRKKIKSNVYITDAHVAASVMRDLSHKDREEFRIIHLDTRKKVIGSETSSIGTIDSALVHPREVFKSAILNNAAAIIVGHNHPSGNPSPSNEDIEVCRILKKAGDNLAISVLDCLVIGKDEYESLNKEV